MYMLITVVNREISTDKFEDFESAYEAMKNDYNEVIADENRVDDCDISKYSAWANVDDGDYQYDWEIVAI